MKRYLRETALSVQAPFLAQFLRIIAGIACEPVGQRFIRNSPGNERAIITIHSHIARAIKRTFIYQCLL